MKKNTSKNDFQSLVEIIVVKSIFFVILVLIGTFVIIPLLQEIHTSQDELKSKFGVYTEISNQGLTYEALKTQNIQGEAGILLPKIGNDFFNANFKNKEAISYIDFLKNKQKYINVLKGNNAMQIRDQKLSKVIPFYSDTSHIDGVMNDFMFVNYLENLLRGFNLKTTSQLGIQQVTPLDSDQNSNQNANVKKNKNQDSYSSQLYYIPLDIELEGKKADILDFLYYSQNVGRVDEVKNESISFYEDNILKNTFLSQNQLFQPNIYENKIFNIESIDFEKYIDTEVLTREESMKNSVGLMNFVKNTSQKDEIIMINMKLRFYVKGIPNYKIEQYIQNISQGYKKNQQQVSSLIKQSQMLKSKLISSNQLNIISELQAIELFLTDNDVSVKSLDGAIKKKEINEGVYKTASSFGEDLVKINIKLEAISKKLRLLQNKK